jgi:xanthine/uracil/vitamin C permease (AzgA family)
VIARALDRWFGLDRAQTSVRAEVLGGATTFFTMAVPAFATIAMVAFTYNIANGLTARLALHPILKLLGGRWRELKGGSAILGGASIAYYLFGLPHSG